jgi:hypothetical protein
MKQQSSPEIHDHRIFGFQIDGQIRANLYNGAGHPEASVMYSWVWADTSSQLAYKLAEQWEQPLNEDEFDALEQLEASHTESAPFIAEFEIDCEECGGSGVDPGGLNAHEPEDCRVCHGAKRVTITRNYLGEAFAISSGQSARPIERQHLTALDAYSRQVMSAYAQKLVAA